MARGRADDAQAGLRRSARAGPFLRTSRRRGPEQARRPRHGKLQHDRRDLFANPHGASFVFERHARIGDPPKLGQRKTRADGHAGMTWAPAAARTGPDGPCSAAGEADGLRDGLQVEGDVTEVEARGLDPFVEDVERVLFAIAYRDEGPVAA